MSLVEAHYLFMAKQRRKYTPAEFKQKFGNVKSVNDFRVLQTGLKKLQIYKFLHLPSAHAAGYIVHDGKDFDKIVPKMFIPSSGVQVTQMAMDDENSGFVVDLLGLRTLTTVKKFMTI